MPVNVLTEAIEARVPLVFVSPHLDDAALSCGGLLLHAARRTPVTVVTIFTEGGPPPYTLSARRYLRLVGARDARVLYQQRREEDRAALEPLGITCVHAGLTEALFRRRPEVPPGRWRDRLLPELAHVYPVYRLQITSGRIAAADAGTLEQASAVVRWLAGSGQCLLLAPLGVGGHVDHVLVHAAAARSAPRVVYYSDFPYNQRPRPWSVPWLPDGLTAIPGPAASSRARTALIESYRTQTPALFRDGSIPAGPEMYFTPGASPVLPGRGKDGKEVMT